MKKKIYESPEITITEIESEDVIATSGLIGQDILIAGEELGYGIIIYDLE